MEATRPNPLDRRVSGHVQLRPGKRANTWCAKWRDATGQHRRRLGPDWPHRSPPDPGYFREREAKAALEAILTDARRGQAAQTRTGLTLADVAESWFTHGLEQRDWKPSTRVDYRSVLQAHLLPAFGALRVEAISPARIERWRIALLRERGISRRNANKLLAILHSIFEHARAHHGLQDNPAAAVRRLRTTYDSARFEFLQPEQVMALARAAASEQDSAIYVTAAFTGLRRGELLALRWRDVDFTNSSIRVLDGYSHGQTTTPKSGRGRILPMVDHVAQVLARLSQRPQHTGPSDVVFCNPDGEHLDGSALRRRYQGALARAEVPRVRFHDLRHTFGSLAINRASIVQVQDWMGHADIKTTMRYLHHKSRAEDAKLLSEAFVSDGVSRLSSAEAVDAS